METPPAWRIADINTRGGAEFAAQHAVGHVTILLFDTQGNHVETIEGVTNTDSLHDSFEKLVASRR